MNLAQLKWLHISILWQTNDVQSMMGTGKEWYSL